MLFAVSVVSVWQERSHEIHFGKIIALVNIGRLPVLHSIMGTDGWGCVGGLGEEGGAPGRFIK